MLEILLLKLEQVPSEIFGEDARDPEHSEGSAKNREMSREARHDIRLWKRGF